jgi:hypothetical protein
VRFHKVRELIVTSEVILEKVHIYNAVDMLTKPIATDKCQRGDIFKPFGSSWRHKVLMSPKDLNIHQSRDCKRWWLKDCKR